MIDVTLENFEAEVVAALRGRTLLVDFWAPWCGPSAKTLGPVLEKLEVAYEGPLQAGQDRLRSGAAAGQHVRHRSIPTCMLMIGGKPVDLHGRPASGKLREFSGQASAHPRARVGGQADADDKPRPCWSPTHQAALQKLADALAADPANDDARFDYIAPADRHRPSEELLPCWLSPSSAFPSRCASKR